jgi:uncharacterized membrane protein
MYYRYGLFGGNGMMGGGGLMMLLAGVLWVLFIVAIVLLVVWLVRAARHDHSDAIPGVQQGGAQSGESASAARDEAIAIARKRFASGKITKEQFDELMKALG